MKESDIVKFYLVLFYSKTTAKPVCCHGFALVQILCSEVVLEENRVLHHKWNSGSNDRLKMDMVKSFC